jgi:hypothetical protein
VRAPLVTGDGTTHEELLVGITWLLEDAVKAGVRYILHISSVAACNHLESQVGVTEDSPCPPLHEYRGSYDDSSDAVKISLTPNQVCTR